MRTLWMLLIYMIVCGNLEAQLSAKDSSFLLQYSTEGIPRKLVKSLPRESTYNYFLVKFQGEIRGEPFSHMRIVRQLSKQYAIIRVSNSGLINEIMNKIDFIYPANDSWKLPPGVSIDHREKKYMVGAIDANAFRIEFGQMKGKIIDHYADNSFLLEIEQPSDAVRLLALPSIYFLQPWNRSPKEELLVNGFDLSTNRINVAHRLFPTINGAGLVVSVKENKFDTADIDFKGRFISTGNSSNSVSGHASIMATMIGGAGNSYHLGKGVAWNTLLSSANFAQLLPASDAFYNQFHISVENHSYGVGIENFYGADAAAYDASANNNRSLVHLFSSGNSGTSASTSGNYAGITNFANLTGSFKMAKNIITVGATDSFANVEVLSSRGPAFDGRVKPELVAFGQDGSSGAAAIASGTVLLIQQAFKLRHPDSLPASALVKAILINSADEIGTPGPDYMAGFGGLNAANAIQSIVDEKYFQGEVSDGDTMVVAMTIPPGIQQFKTTLAYTDLPAQPNAFKALINDLDLELVQVSSGQIWRPWILSSAANKDSLSLPAIRGIDSLNNVEQVSIDNPVAGAYQLRIIGRSVTSNTQSYSVVYKMDSINSFQWNFPTRTDPVFAGSNPIARWNSTVAGTGRLELSSDGGNSWQLINGNVDLSKKYLKWQVPDSFHSAMLRMTVNGNSFVSDTFVVSRNLQIQVGFNCPDSVLLHWNQIDKADQYRVYALTSNFLQPIALRSDTFFIFSKADINSRHFTVAPVKQTSEGIKAFTIDYETQGVGCYFKEFLVRLDGDKAIIEFALGTLYHIRQIEIQKDNGNDFLTVQTVSNPTQLAYLIEHSNLHAGVNKFRIKITLNDGRFIYSSQETIYYLNKQDFIFYPNPAPLSKGFSILRINLEEETLILYDVYGKRIKVILLQDLVNPINTSSLQRGVYFVMILDKNGNRRIVQKIVLQ